MAFIIINSIEIVLKQNLKNNDRIIFTVVYKIEIEQQYLLYTNIIAFVVVRY